MRLPHGVVQEAESTAALDAENASPNHAHACRCAHVHLKLKLLQAT